MEYYCFLKTMFELLLDYLQIRFGNLDTCGQDVLDTDNDIRPVGICRNLAFNAGEIALDNTHPVAYNKSHPDSTWILRVEAADIQKYYPRRTYALAVPSRSSEAFPHGK